MFLTRLRIVWVYVSGYRSAAVAGMASICWMLDLSEAYEQAWDEWEATGEAALWEVAADDGI